jgi:hypothetical protein
VAGRRVGLAEHRAAGLSEHRAGQAQRGQALEVAGRVAARARAVGEEEPAPTPASSRANRSRAAPATSPASTLPRLRRTTRPRAARARRSGGSARPSNTVTRTSTARWMPPAKSSGARDGSACRRRRVRSSVSARYRVRRTRTVRIRRGGPPLHTCARPWTTERPS